MINITSVSVIVPAYNSESTIQQTIQAIQKQTYQNIEIIIVDDGSKDRTAEIVKAFPKINYLYQENAGPAAARNRGAKAATSEILFFTDADCIPKSDWIEKVLEGFKNSSIGVVCGSYGIANPENILARCIHQEIIYRHQKLMNDYPNVFGSYNFAVVRKVFEEVGGFNTVYRNASGEDNDLSYKILNSGKKIFFKKDALVDHFHQTSLPRYLKEQFRHGFWRVQMYKHYPKMMKGDGYTFWKDWTEVGAALAVCVFLIAGLFFKNLLPVAEFLFFILLLLELFFGILMTKNIFEGFYYSFVMLLRAFARKFGFSTGVLYFLFKKR